MMAVLKTGQTARVSLRASLGLGRCLSPGASSGIQAVVSSGHRLFASGACHRHHCKSHKGDHFSPDWAWWSGGAKSLPISSS